MARAHDARQPLARRRLSYVLPLRRWDAAEDRELADYLHWLAHGAEVIVVDGSAETIFAAHRRSFGAGIRHLAVDAELTGRYGKVNGVITGVRAASHEKVIIADDDVRYGEEQLARVWQLLDRHHLVRPQNYFDPAPWHARWDTARSLLNRAVGSDFPGTLGVRRSAFLAVGGYDGDCLFENLELIRTVEAAGGSVASPLDLFIRRLPPTARRFVSQRVRQAYDDLALPGRLAAELALAPAAAWALRRRSIGLVAGAGAGAIAVAEIGRRRGGGRSVYARSAALWAPAWVAERGVCIWLAVGSRLLWGGVPYAGTVLSKTATPARLLRRRLAGRLSSCPTGAPWPPRSGTRI